MIVRLSIYIKLHYPIEYIAFLKLANVKYIWLSMLGAHLVSSAYGMEYIWCGEPFKSTFHFISLIKVVGTSSLFLHHLRDSIKFRYAVFNVYAIFSVVDYTWEDVRLWTYILSYTRITCVESKKKTAEKYWTAWKEWQKKCQCFLFLSIAALSGWCCVWP